jgi:hypothetical protein
VKEEIMKHATLGLLLAAGACSGSDAPLVPTVAPSAPAVAAPPPSAPPPPEPPPVAPPVATVPLVTITPNGVQPASITVAAGTRVTFVNEDVIPHDINGGPDIAHPDCREIDAVGFLAPGQRRQTDPLTQVRMCEYHDHQFHAPQFTGRIFIQ